MNSRIGQQFGNYRLTRLLSRGGFAEVYLAEHTILETLVAIKLLYRHLTPQDLQNFLYEAKTLAALRHPHIVRILDFGQIDEMPFLVMDYAPGGTLRQRHPQGSVVPLPAVVSYVKQIASALQHTHNSKRIHRDVKPENMLLDEHGQLLLSDFGIVAIAHSTSSMKTQESIGTVYYMAPEQIQRKPRPASDQYSLATTVYEWLCGECPFAGDSHINIAMQQILDDPPPLRQKAPGISSRVEQVVMHALSKDPEKRYPNIQEFAVALEQAMQLAISQPQPVTRPRAALNIVGRAQPVLSLPAPTTFVRPPTHQTQPPGELVLEYNGHHGGVSALAWSPNGRFIVSGSEDGTILLWNAISGANMLTLAGHLKEVLALGWSPDGRYVASGSADYTVQVWEVATGKNFRIYGGHSGKVTALGWSPDGRWLASGSWDKTVQVWEAATGKQVYIYKKHSNKITALGWSPDGRMLASGSWDKTVQVWEVATGKRVYTYKKHSNWVDTFQEHASWVHTLGWSPDGRLLAGSWDKTVHVWGATTGKRVYIYERDAGWISTLGWSPDGRWLASGSWYERDHTIQVWEATTGRHIYTYTGHEADINMLSWSPDGNLIASASDNIHVWRAPS